VFQVDESWDVGNPGALLHQDDYLNQEFSTDEDVRSAQDPFRLFTGEKPRRCDYFRNAHYEYACARQDRVPFMWDFGFILARAAPWQAASGESLASTLNRDMVKGTTSAAQQNLAACIVPLKTGEDRVQTIFDFLSDPHKYPDLRSNGGISWRKFFGACKVVADSHRAQTGAAAMLFDISGSNSETINSLLLEVWFSEIILEQKLRGCAAENVDQVTSANSEDIFAKPLEGILLDGCEQRTTIHDAFKAFQVAYRGLAIRNYQKLREQPSPVHEGSGDRDATRVERIKMFGGIAAKVNGHFFAGLFGRSAIVQLPEPERAEALALEGAGPFDPMGNGRVMSEKVMLPESMMADEEELRAWLSRAFQAALVLAPKAAKTAKTKAAKPKAKVKAKAKAKTKTAARKTAAPAKKRSTAKARARRR